MIKEILKGIIGKKENRKEVEKMKVSLKDLSKEHIWEVAEVDKIPPCWRRRVYYDLKSQELFTELLTGNQYSMYPESVIFLEEFDSLESWYAQIPYSAIELGVEVDESGEPDREQLLNAYKTIWFENYVVPEIYEGGENND